MFLFNSIKIFQIIECIAYLSLFGCSMFESHSFATVGATVGALVERQATSPTMEVQKYRCSLKTLKVL